MDTCLVVFRWRGQVFMGVDLWKGDFARCAITMHELAWFWESLCIWTDSSVQSASSWFSHLIFQMCTINLQPPVRFFSSCKKARFHFDNSLFIWIDSLRGTSGASLIIAPVLIQICFKKMKNACVPIAFLSTSPMHVPVSTTCWFPSTTINGSGLKPLYLEFSSFIKCKCTVPFKKMPFYGNADLWNN